MPGNGLPFAVGVGGVQHFIRGFGVFLQFFQHFPFAADGDVMGRETVFHIDAEFAFGEVADVSHGGDHFIIFT